MKRSVGFNKLLWLLSTRFPFQLSKRREHWHVSRIFLHRFFDISLLMWSGFEYIQGEKFVWMTFAAFCIWLRCINRGLAEEILLLVHCWFYTRNTVKRRFDCKMFHSSLNIVKNQTESFWGSHSVLELLERQRNHKYCKIIEANDMPIRFIFCVIRLLRFVHVIETVMNFSSVLLRKNR